MAAGEENAREGGEGKPSAGGKQGNLGFWAGLLWIAEAAGVTWKRRRVIIFGNSIISIVLSPGDVYVPSMPSQNIA